MNTNAYLFGIICTAVISISSLSGVVILPLIRGKSRKRWMQVFIALAVATLSADALLHLLPAVLGTHKHTIDKPVTTTVEKSTSSNISALERAAAIPESSHEGREHDHDHNHDQEGREQGHDKSSILKMSTLMLAVYVFYLFEFVAHWGLSKNRKKSLHAVHPVSNGSALGNGKAGGVEAKEKDPSSGGHGHSHGGVGGETEVCFGFKSVALMILFGDGVHNFVDGVAVGASFAVSNSLGFSTSIAVVFHEIPHEIGDFAVLVDSGLSVRKALVMNLVSAFTAFIGLVVGIEVGQNEDLIPWLLAAAAGMFLYVAWIDMLNHLKTEVDANDSWYLTLALQNVGFLVGFVIIFLIGWFEEDLQFFD